MGKEGEGNAQMSRGGGSSKELAMRNPSALAADSCCCFFSPVAVPSPLHAQLLGGRKPAISSTVAKNSAQSTLCRSRIPFSLSTSSAGLAEKEKRKSS